MYLFFLLLSSLIFSQPIFAQEVTPTPNKTLTEEVREMVTNKVKEIQQTSKEIVSNVSNTPKSLIGTITKIDTTKITISYKNESKNITLNTDTVFIDAKKNKTKIENLKVGQDILIMGYFDQFNNLEAKRIVITELKTIENKNEIVLGKIVDISQASPVFVLIPIKNKEAQYQIKTDSKSEIIDKDGNKLTIDKLKSGQKIIVVIQPDAKIAKTFYVSKIITLDTPTAQIPETPVNN
ncbi:MAG: DUF5666 domain-containing protein [Candidatus Shapirobacteria bacterium]|jgi:hypothetical protein|nr:DUF5666 domain-containing protein [Candidatus Shapirobacteria bacterium]